MFTSFKAEDVSTRVKIEPTSENGLEKISYVMTEKIITVDKALLGKCIGNLTSNQMSLISGKLAKVLDIHRNDIEIE